eukprot:jgi/Picre1/32255/NNA_007601.t1
MNRSTTLALLLLFGVSAVCSQELPTERPKDCDGSTCKGCTPFVPKPGKAIDNLCGIVDVYFPVPIYVVRNDTSPGQELISQQWACFACCTLGCGFDEPQNTCAYDNYNWEEGQTYGCTKCRGGDVLVPNGGNVKTSFADLSTSSVYSVINQPYGACAPAGTATPSPPPSVPVEPSPVASPSPSPVPSPSPQTPPPAPIEQSPEPNAIPPTTEEPDSSPEPITNSPAPAPDAQPEPSPEPFVPISIDSSSPPTPSSSGMRKTIASVTLALVMMQFIFF